VQLTLAILQRAAWVDIIVIIIIIIIIIISHCFIEIQSQMVVLADMINDTSEQHRSMSVCVFDEYVTCTERRATVRREQWLYNATHILDLLTSYDAYIPS